MSCLFFSVTYKLQFIQIRLNYNLTLLENFYKFLSFNLTSNTLGFIFQIFLMLKFNFNVVIDK